VTIPTITAIIPLYNGRDFIKSAVESVLAQTLPPTELIIVDDGSTDHGADIVEQLAQSHPLKLLRKANGGQSSARNHGVANSGGDLIALLDQDDIWYPDHLRELVKPFMEQRPVELGWAYSNLDEMDREGMLIGHNVLDNCTTPHPKDNLFTCLREDMFILPTSSMISRTAFEALGGFDESLSGYEDDDLFLRMFRAGYDHVYIERALARWRVHATSASYSKRMAISRMLFARKLLRDFPDDTSNRRYFRRDLIAPRFLPQAIVEARKALRSQDTATIDTCIADVELLRQHINSGSGVKRTQQEFLISAVIPLYNGADFIQDALDSVLAQTMAPDEIIVVDDGSTDNGLEIVENMSRFHPIKILTKPNGGQSSARNLGIAHARGDMIALLDQDDVWYPHHLARLLEPFTEARPIDESLSGYEDDDLFLRMFRAGYENIFIDAPLSKWRIYPTSSSYSYRMARSRRIYAEKLLRAYPDEPRDLKYYTTGIIAPRFLTQMLAEYRKAIVYGTQQESELAFRDLCFIAPFLRRRWRYIVMAGLPLLWFRPVARLLFSLAGFTRDLLPGTARRR
jgi:glycosyltransferase involved in cell wall biosynthesis